MKHPPKTHYTIDDFCALYGMNRSTFYRMLREGSGPEVIREKGYTGEKTVRVYIAKTAAKEWEKR